MTAMGTLAFLCVRRTKIKLLCEPFQLRVKFALKYYFIAEEQIYNIIHMSRQSEGKRGKNLIFRSSGVRRIHANLVMAIFPTTVLNNSQIQLLNK